MANAPELSGAPGVSLEINSGSRVERAEILAHAIIRAFQALRPERRPCAGTEYPVICHVVHIDWNTQHRRERNQVRAHVAVADGAVVRAPIIHHGIDIAEGAQIGRAHV